LGKKIKESRIISMLMEIGRIDLWTGLGWALGLGVIFAGYKMLGESVLTGIIFILAGLFILLYHYKD
jgi:uncharacterized membrane protein